MFSLHKGLAKHKGRMVEQWVFDAHSPLLSSAAVADIDGDGKAEVVFGTKQGAIICVDEHANEKWKFTMSNDMAKSDEYFFDLEKLVFTRKDLGSENVPPANKSKEGFRKIRAQTKAATGFPGKE